MDMYTPDSLFMRLKLLRHESMRTFFAKCKGKSLANGIVLQVSQIIEFYFITLLLNQIIILLLNKIHTLNQTKFEALNCFFLISKPVRLMAFSAHITNIKNIYNIKNYF